MPLNIDQKRAVVAELNETAKSASSTLVADFSGVNVTELTGMRARARESGVEVRVIRNTLAKRAFEGTDHACLHDALIGPTMLAFSREDPAAAARLFKEFAAECDELDVRAISLGGRLHDGAELSKIASMPTRDEAIAQLMGVMKAPVAKLARTIKEVPSKLVRTLLAVRDQKAGDE